MTRVASLYLPHWPIDRLRRAERAHAPRPEAAPAGLDAPAFDRLGRIAAEERDGQCSVPATPGWRPGARWARSEGDAPTGSRAAVEAAVAALPAHRRPPQREMGRVSEPAANPFAGAAPLREMARRTEAAEHPFANGARGQATGAVPSGGQWLDPAALDAAIAALPAHQRPSFGELSRRSELADHPFRPMPADEPGRFAPSPPVPPLQFPGEDAPAKAARGIGTRAAALAQAARLPPVNWPGEDVRGRAEQRDARPARRPTSRDGHAGEANGLPAPSLAASLTQSLAQLAAMPSVAYPGEGPHPDNHGRSEPTAPSYGQGRFFQTGRTLGSLVARICPEEAERDDAPAAASPLPPLVTVAREGGRVTIQAACPAALALGITPGTALTQARAGFPELDVRDADPAGDAADLARLALTLARRWTPVVAPSGADGLILDLTGVSHLHGGEARMARRLVRLLARHGVTARVAVADTAGAAWALARFGRTAAIPLARRVRGGPQPGGNGRGAPGWSHDAATGTVAGGAAVLIVPPCGHIDALAPLPVAALRIAPRAAELLAQLGVDTVGQLAAMPRGPLVRRFGTAPLARLDQASGRLPEPLDPVIPLEPVVTCQRFAEPIATAEAIAHWLGDLVPRLAEALARDGMGARLVELIADRVDGVPQVIRVGLARPTREPAHLLRLLTRRIEEIEPGYGIDALALHVRRADPLGPEPLAPHLAEETSPDLAPLIDALANRIGPARLWRCSPVESDVPERSVARVPPLDPPAAGARAVAADDVRRLDERPRDHPWHPRWPRPVRLLRRPEPIDNVIAGLPDQPPRRFTWRGRVHQVVRADGPERIAGEWWRRTSEAQAVRDYFHVEDEAGDRFWLYRRGDGVRAETGDLAWFMHGRLG